MSGVGRARHARVSDLPMLAAVAVVLAAGLGGCAVSSGLDQPKLGVACVDDSIACVEQRGIALKKLMSDKERKFVREPASAEAYASGVRLFALKERRRELSCDELKHAKAEADGAPTVLRGPEGQGLTPAQISRGLMFGEEVSRELGKEARRRCRA